MKLKSGIYAMFFCFLFFVYDYESFFKASVIILISYLLLCLLFKEARGTYILCASKRFSFDEIFCGLKLKTWLYLVLTCYLLSIINPHLSQDLSFYNSILIISIFIHTSVWLLLDYKVYAKDQTHYFHQLRSSGVDSEKCIEIIHRSKF